jgi:hypothetical protein
MNRASQFRLLAVLFAVTLMPFLLEAENPGAKKLTVSLAKPVPYNAGAPYADSVAIADVNGDGIPDLILADFCQSLGLNGCTGTGQAAVLLGNGDGTFQPAITYSTGGYLAYSVRIASLNSGEVPALVVANLCLNLDQYGDCTGIGGVGVLLGNGDGTFQPAVAYSTGGDGALSVAVGNLDDEEPDLVIANVYGSDGSDSSAAVLLNNGDGTFQSAVNYGSGGYQADWVEIADMNGDGIQDLVLSNLCQAEGCYTDGEVAVLLGNGDGTFQPATTYESGGPVSYSVAAADLRGNGIMDVVITNRFNGGSAAKNSVSVLLGNGDGTLQPAQAYLLSGFQFDAVAIGDLNGDGIPDQAVIEECQTLIHHEGCGGTGLISVLLGNGDGTFQPPAKYGSGGYKGQASRLPT